MVHRLWPGWSVSRCRRRDQAHHVAVPVRQVAHHTECHHGDVLLGFAVTGLGSHAPAGIGNEQDGLAPHGDVPFDERRSEAGGSLPVDVADIVPGDVGAQVIKVEAASAENGTVFAVEHAAGFPVGEDGHLRLHAL